MKSQIRLLIVGLFLLSLSSCISTRAPLQKDPPTPTPSPQPTLEPTFTSIPPTPEPQIEPTSASTEQLQPTEQAQDNSLYYGCDLARLTQQEQAICGTHLYSVNASGTNDCYVVIDGNKSQQAIYEREITIAFTENSLGMIFPSGSQIEFILSEINHYKNEITNEQSDTYYRTFTVVDAGFDWTGSPSNDPNPCTFFDYRLK
jgi:hypothetical protein